jgi:5'-nucleotidase (lipoprotein e(P4) family)
MRRLLFVVLLLPVLIVAQAVPNQRPVIAHETLLATLWVQTSVEYRAITLQTYRGARRVLDAALADKTWTAALEQTGAFADKPPAIVLDIDETVIDNSPYQARQVLHQRNYQQSEWRQWTSEKKAEAIPGAVEFLQYAASRGVTVFFASNRADDGTPALTSERADTLATLQKAGFPVSEETLLLTNQAKGWSGDKTTRRQFIAERYRIIMMFGDDLNDFLSVRGLNVEQRNQKAKPYEAYWGERWFALPNPTYGSFDRALMTGKPASTEGERLSAKEAQLVTKE